MPPHIEQGAKHQLRKRGSASLEDAFISYLAEAAGIKVTENSTDGERSCSPIWSMSIA
jgi:hypothetical protein